LGLTLRFAHLDSTSFHVDGRYNPRSRSQVEPHDFSLILLKQLSLGPRRPQGQRSTDMPAGTLAVRFVSPPIPTWLWRGVARGRVQKGTRSMTGNACRRRGPGSSAEGSTA
jgi:hypothetical protein